MISATSYQPIFQTLVLLLTIVLTVRYQTLTDSQVIAAKGGTSKLLGWILAVSMAVFVGTRPMSAVFVDMVNYNAVYHSLRIDWPFNFSMAKENYLFDNLFDWLASNKVDIFIFFLIIAAIYFIVTYKAMTRLFKGNALYAYVAWLAAFSTFSYATNGIKAGAAAALFVCAIAYRDRKLWAVLLLAASLGFHHSMVVPLAAFCVALFYRNTKTYFIVWGVCILLAAAHVTYFQELFAGLSSESVSKHYLAQSGTDWGGKTGFRWDFILYSALPLGVAYYTLIVKKVKSDTYAFMVNIYLMVNSIWLLCMYMPFNNRTAYLSWCIYPVVLVYPFLNCRVRERQTTWLNIVTWIQLSFTLVFSML